METSGQIVVVEANKYSIESLRFFVGKILQSECLPFCNWQPGLDSGRRSRIVLFLN